MARVQIEEVVDHLSYEMRRALSFAVESAIPDARFDDRELFRAFIRGIRRKCNTWEEVPDHYIEND